VLLPALQRLVELPDWDAWTELLLAFYPWPQASQQRFLGQIRWVGSLGAAACVSHVLMSRKQGKAARGWAAAACFLPGPLAGRKVDLAAAVLSFLLNGWEQQPSGTAINLGS
jgi:hypothetical protein